MSPLKASLAVAAVLVWAMAVATLVGFGLAAWDLGIPLSEFEPADGMAWIRPRLLVLGGLQWLFFLPAALWLGPRLGYDRSSIGLDRPGRPLHVAITGVLFGAALIGVPGLLGRLAGGFVDGDGASTGVLALPGILVAGAILTVMALGEEVLFRGILLRRWEEQLGSRGALALTTALFVVLHGANPGVSVLGLVGLGLAGTLLGLAALRSGSVWWPVGIHFGWNGATGLVLGLPVSGISLPSLMRWTPADDAAAIGLWGGPFGPEAGIVFHTALLVGIVVVALRLRNPDGRVRPEAGLS
jgi:membrane protease YdiL (CAAX protease family)